MVKAEKRPDIRIALWNGWGEGWKLLMNTIEFQLERNRPY
jgi:hypothetical protein